MFAKVTLAVKRFTLKSYKSNTSNSKHKKVIFFSQNIKKKRV